MPDEQSQEEGQPAEQLLNTVYMPWLVPACSPEKLREAVDRDSVALFEGLNIAGLVPGGTTNRMDAKAHSWSQNVPISWAFEFRARRSYSVNEACENLVTKCGDDQSHHGMLIAVSEHRHSVCQSWTVEVDGRLFLRVVVLVGNKR